MHADTTEVQNAAPKRDLAADARLRAMLEAPPLALLVRMATPNALAFVVQAAVSMVEASFIGRLGTVSLAAIALIFPGLMLMQMLSGGAMGGAVTSAIARSLGRKDSARAERLIWHALVLAVAAGAVFFVLNGVFGRALLHGLGAAPAVADEATDYANVLFAGCVVVWTTSILGGVYRGLGDMRTPAVLMVLSAAIQVPFSGALILGWWGLPQWGIVGGAISLLTVSLLNSGVLISGLVRRSGLRLRWNAMRFEGALFADILRVGALASLSPIFVVLTIGSLNALIADFGTAVLAGYGIGARLEFLLIPLVFGIGASMTSLVGVNVGARNIARAERIGWTGGTLAALLTGVVGATVALFPQLWVDLFTADAATRVAGSTYLQIVGPVFLFQGLGLSLYFASQGAGTVVWPVVATILRFVVAVGGAMSLVRSGQGLPGVCVAIAAGMVLYGVLTAASVKVGAWRRVAAG